MSGMDRLRLPARLDSMGKFQAFVQEKTRLRGGEKLAARIELALEEILVNIIRYAYPDSPGDVQVSCRLLEGPEFVLEVQDWGKPFNPLTRQNPDPHQELQSRPIGGWGISLVRQMADTVAYSYHEGKNTLRLTFL